MTITVERDQLSGSQEGAGAGLRAFLEQAERIGKLRHVHGANADAEIGAATEVLQQAPESPIAVFDHVPGYDPSFRVAVNTLGSTDTIALALGMLPGQSKREVANAWRDRVRRFQPINAEVVADGPVFENVRRGDEVDLSIFPVPKWHPNDGGRYIGTGSYDVTRDPDDGWINCGTYRVMLQGHNKLGYYISPGKHGRVHRQKYFDRHEPCPVVMVFGGDPLMFLASATEVQFGITEFDWVSGMRGQPMQLVRGPVTGLPFPADAEIVVEGFATADEMLPEGPFGEWTGYYASDTRPEPVLKVEALYYRNAPILVGSPPGRPPDELAKYRAIMRSALLHDQLEKAGIPDIVGVWCHEAGGSRLLNVVSLKQRYPGHTRQALHVAAQCHAGAYAGRWVIAVDDDIDPANLEEVMWAMSTRADPATSIDIVHRAWSTPLDPRITPEQRAARDFTNSRGLIDATRPFEWRNQFPLVNTMPADMRQAAEERWGYLLRDER